MSKIELDYNNKKRLVRLGGIPGRNYITLILLNYYLLNYFWFGMETEKMNDVMLSQRLLKYIEAARVKGGK